MKNTLSKNIQLFIFNEDYFDSIYQNNPDLIKNDPSLLFKSIHVENPTAFCWLAKRVDISNVWKSLFFFILSKKRFLAHYYVLKKIHPEIFENIENKRFIFNRILSSLNWYKTGNNTQKIKLFTKLAKDNHFITSEILEDLILKKSLLPLAIDSMKAGIMPLHKDNIFADFCKNGSPEYVPFFKGIGCNIHYMNDLSLIKASESNNMNMVRHLVEKEGADLSVGNYFPLLTVFTEDEYSEKEKEISNEMIVFFAEYAYGIPSFPKSILKKLLKNKKFKIAYQFIEVNNNLKDKNDVTPFKKKINKI